VVEKDKANVALPDGKVVEAKVIGRDPTTDLAVLKVEATGLQPLATTSDLKVGQIVLALGRPGVNVQATIGILSAVEESWRTGAGGLVDQYVQTDVLMYPGFSGGPLVSAAGQLIGLNSSALSRGASLTIPAATIQRIASTLLSHGKLKKGYLGITTQAVRLPQTIAEQVSQPTGLLIAGIEANSPAEQSGLFMGDTIVKFAGTSIRHHDDLLVLLNGSTAGQKNPMTIVRSGKLEELSVLVGEKE
jgi:S1-C subfamily serine protease